MEKEVVDLYLQNFSGLDISNKLGIHIRQVYRILDKNKIQRRLTSEQNRIKFLNKKPSFEIKDNLSVWERELLIAAVMLYYGEGAKTGTTVDLANSDPGILKLFLKFLREICGVDTSRLRFYLYCFSDQNPVELIRFWSRELTVSRNNFTKPYIRKIQQEKPRRRMPYGVLHIRYSDKKLLTKILELNLEFVKKWGCDGVVKRT